MAFHSSRNIPLTDLEITFLGKNDGKKGGRVTEQARREVKKKKKYKSEPEQMVAGKKREGYIFLRGSFVLYTSVIQLWVGKYSP